jgi:hypothetical protein
VSFVMYTGLDDSAAAKCKLEPPPGLLYSQLFLSRTKLLHLSLSCCRCLHLVRWGHTRREGRHDTINTIGAALQLFQLVCVVVNKWQQ